MKVRTLFAAAALVLASGTVFAMHCPADMKAIDDALAKKPQLAAAEMAEVTKLRADGEALHKAGKHQEAVDALAKARKILGI
jgi:Tfp pilus assembly protein PilN